MASNKKQIGNKKSALLVVCIVLVSCIAVGSTLAFIIDKSGVLTNIFSPASVEINVEGTTVTNTGDVDAYVRMTYVVTLVSTSNENVYYGGQPLTDDDYEATPTYDSQLWVVGSDGYYYYKNALAKNATLTIPTVTVTPINYTVPSGYKLVVQYLVSAVQATPKDAVIDSWGVTLDGDTIQSVP